MKLFSSTTTRLYPIILTLIIGLYSCGGSGDEERASPPSLSILSPKDTLSLTDKVPIEILFSDNSGLVSAEISLGNVNLGNLVYHYSQRGLNGLSDQLKFDAEIPTTVNAEGENYILIKCYDEDGNETFIEGAFYLVNNDLNPPSINAIIHQGILTRDPQSAMSVAYDISDDKGLASLTIAFEETSNGSTIGNTIVSQTINFNGELNSQSFTYFAGSPGYPSGASYKILARAYDQEGNMSEYLSPNEFTIAN